MAKKPLVSVCMLTYKHENYVLQAIEGVYMQQTNFDFELVIANDCSPDNTDTEIKDVLKHAHERLTVNYIKHDKNIGMIPNFLFALEHCHGDYISMCEGDDYWIDPLMLQKQVDFLEIHEKYNLVTGYVKQYLQNTGEFLSVKNKIPYDFTYKDMIVKNQCSTCTTMIRNFIKDEGFNYVKNMGTDSQLWIQALGSKGLGRKMNEEYAVYRRHDESYTKQRWVDSNSKHRGFKFMKRKILKAEFWNDYFDNNAVKSVILVKENVYLKMTAVSYKQRDFFNSFKYGVYYIKAKLFKVFL